MNNLNNRVQLVGRLGNAPELKTFGKDKKMAPSDCWNFGIGRPDVLGRPKTQKQINQPLGR